MARDLKEWAGKTDDTPAPKRVRLRIFERCNGICHISGRRIQAGEKWELDHVTALILGGENRESNLAPALVEHHKTKTAGEVAQKSKDRRVRAKHIGLHRPKSIVPGSKASRWKKKLNGQVVLRDGGKP